MTLFARLEKNTVVEIIEPIEGIVIESRFPAHFVDELIECGADVQCGWIFDGVAFSPPKAALTDIRTLKSEFKIAVDLAAETERLKYITPGTGQAMTYQQKVAEAQAYKAATNPQASDYPILSSEVGITAETNSEVADVVLAAFARWQQIGAMIESIRLGAKRDIDAAEDEAAARAIVVAIVWPSAQVQS